jgi:L-rhamnose isomerase/sugar isomerase
MGAFQILRRAYNFDVAPLIAMARVEAGGAADPIRLYRETDWRGRKAQERKPASGTAGIV